MKKSVIAKDERLRQSHDATEIPKKIKSKSISNIQLREGMMLKYKIIRKQSYDRNI